MPAQDSGSLDQNIQLIRTLFCSRVGHSFDDVFSLSSTCSGAFLPPPVDVVSHNGSPSNLFFYLASNGIWKSAAATYLHVCQALREPFVRSFRGEWEVKQSAAGHWVTQYLKTTQGLFSGKIRDRVQMLSDRLLVSEERNKSTLNLSSSEALWGKKTPVWLLKWHFHICESPFWCSLSAADVMLQWSRFGQFTEALFDTHEKKFPAAATEVCLK